MNDNEMNMPQQQYVIMYSTPEGDVRVQAVIKDETMWLTQRGIATLFDVGVPAINKHINNIYKEGELRREATVSKMEIVQSEGEHMGLTTWQNAPNGRILKSDVVVAKNYLQPDEIRRLERAVTGYFDYIEDLIERENSFTMTEFASSVNEFLAFRRYQILPDNAKGAISHAEAEAKAAEEYEKFKRIQKIISDFDLDFGLAKGGVKNNLR